MVLFWSNSADFGPFIFFFGQNQLIFRKIQGVPYKMVLFLLKIGHFLKKGPSISYKIAFFPFLKLMDGPQTPKRAIFRKFTGCSIRNGTFLVKNGGFSPKNVPFFMEHPVFPKIQDFGPNFHHLFATITQNYRVFHKKWYFFSEKWRFFPEKTYHCLWNTLYFRKFRILDLIFTTFSPL